MRNKTVRAAMLLVGLVLAVSVAPAQVLQQVPGDAMVVVKFHDLAGTSARIGAWAKGMGLDMPPFNDLLGFGLMQTQLAGGLNRNGELAVAMFVPEEDAPPSPLILFPIADYAAFVQKFGQTEKVDGFDRVQFRMGKDATPMLMAKWGAYAAASPSKAILSKKPGGLQLAGPSAALVQGKGDVSVYVNGSAVRAKALPMFKEQRGQVVEMGVAAFKQGGGQDKYLPVIRILMNQALNLVQDMLEGGNAAVVAMNISDKGLNTTAMADFAPQSRMGKLFGQMKNSDAALTKGIPQGEYVMYGGYVQNAQASAKFVADLIDPAVKELAALGAEGQAMVTAIDAVKAQLAAINGGAFGLLVEPGSKTGLLKAVQVVDGNAQAIMDSAAKMQKVVDQLTALMPGPRTEVVYTAKAKTVDGVSLDKVQAKVKADPQKPEEMMAAQMMAMLYGPGGSTNFMGAVNATRYVQVMGDDEALLAKAVAAAKAGQDPFAQNAGAKAVAATLPQNRCAVAFIAVDKAIKAGMAVANQQMGGNLNMQLPPNLPPIGMSVAAEGSAIRMDMHVPTQLIQGIYMAILQMQMRQPAGGDGNL
jgi:hypothetical protein